MLLAARDECLLKKSITHCEDFFSYIFTSLGLSGPKGYKHKPNLFFYYFVNQEIFFIEIKYFKTFNNGSLGSRIDEERSELR